MSRSIGGQSRVYQPVSGGLVNRRARVLTPVVPEGCVFTESFNKADGTLGPDLAWVVPPSTDYGGVNTAVVSSSQFGFDLTSPYLVDPEAYAPNRATALTVDEVCADDCYVEATISRVQGDAFYTGVLLYLRANTSLGGDDLTDQTYAQLGIYSGLVNAVSIRLVVDGDFDGSEETYDTPTVTFSAGQRVRFEAEGSTYRAYLDGDLLLTATEGSVHPRERHAGLGLEWIDSIAGDLDPRLDAFELGSL